MIEDSDLDQMWKIISFLLTSEEATAYSEALFDITTWGSALWAQKSAEVLSVMAHLIRVPQNAFSRSFIDVIAINRCVLNCTGSLSNILN